MPTSSAAPIVRLTRRCSSTSTEAPGPSGFKQYQGLPILNALAKAGWVCVSVGYRLSPLATFRITSRTCTAEFIGQTECPSLGGDPSFTAVCGKAPAPIYRSSPRSDSTNLPFVLRSFRTPTSTWTPASVSTASTT